MDFFPLPIVYISFLIFLYFPCDLLHFPFNQTHVRAYHVNLSCGLHGADDVVLAGEQKVKYFVLIGCLDFWGEDSPLGSPNSKKKILSHRAFLEELLVTVCMGRTRLQAAALSCKKLAGKTGKKPQKITWLSHLLLHPQSPARNCPRKVLKNLWNEHQKPKSFCFSGHQPQTQI